MKHLIIIAVLFVSVSCQKEHERQHRDFEIVTPESSQFDLVFPKPLWTEILNAAPLTIDTSESVYDFFETLPMQVEIVEGKGRAFGGSSYRFDFKEFGGLIDFDIYLDRSTVGSFKLYFNFPNLVSTANMKVYFLSWTDQYQKGDEKFGNGCGNFYDITRYFNQTVLKDGLLLHTKDYRYLDLAAGRLYFVNYADKKIQLAQVTLTDKKLEERLCADRI